MLNFDNQNWRRPLHVLGHWNKNYSKLKKTRLDKQKWEMGTHYFIRRKSSKRLRQSRNGAVEIDTKESQEIRYACWSRAKDGKYKQPLVGSHQNIEHLLNWPSRKNMLENWNRNWNWETGYSTYIAKKRKKRRKLVDNSLIRKKLKARKVLYPASTDRLSPSVREVIISVKKYLLEESRGFYCSSRRQVSRYSPFSLHTNPIGDPKKNCGCAFSNAVIPITTKFLQKKSSYDPTGLGHRKNAKTRFRRE